MVYRPKTDILYQVLWKTNNLEFWKKDGNYVEIWRKKIGKVEKNLVIGKMWKFGKTLKIWKKFGNLIIR